MGLKEDEAWHLAWPLLLAIAGTYIFAWFLFQFKFHLITAFPKLLLMVSYVHSLNHVAPHSYIARPSGPSAQPSGPSAHRCKLPLSETHPPHPPHPVLQHLRCSHKCQVSARKCLAKHLYRVYQKLSACLLLMPKKLVYCHSSLCSCFNALTQAPDALLLHACESLPVQDALSAQTMSMFAEAILYCGDNSTPRILLIFQTAAYRSSRVRTSPQVILLAMKPSATPDK